MMARPRPPGFFKRVLVWLKSPFRYKLYSVAVRIFRIAKKIDNDIIRSANFETQDPAQKFSIAGHGQEKYVVINFDKAISKILYVNGSFDFAKVETAISIMRKINKDFRLETLIDIGANIGTVCIPAVKRGLATKAIAVEPEPLNYRVLVANIFLNDLADKIVARNLAFGCENNQTLEFELSSSNSGDHRVRIRDDSGIHSEGSRNTISVKSETFDSIIPPLDRNSCLVWMDTQGYEGFVLQGAQKAIHAQVPMVIEFWPYGMKRAGSFAALKSAIMSYSEYRDLADINGRPVKISEATLDHLYEQIGETGDWTDILLI